MATDLSLTSSAQVLALINTDNVATVPAGGLILGTHVTFGTAAVNDNPGATTNTKLTVTSAVNSGYVGSVEVEYDRLDLVGFEAYGPAEIIIPDTPTLQDVIDAFNVLYESNLQLEDIDETVTLPEPDFDGETYTLTAKASSYAFIGTIDVVLSLASTPLSTIITNPVLNGLEFPAP